MGKRMCNIAGTVLVVLVVLLAVALVGVRLVGLEPYVILSGSMEPVYPVGSLVYVQRMDADRIAVGDPIAFVMNEDLVVAIHRVIGVDAAAQQFETKGDANAAAGAVAFLIDDTAPVENEFKPSEVTCEVAETFENGVKKDVKIQNTGDIPAYIRVALVTYFVDGDNVDGSKTATIPNFTMGAGRVKNGEYYYFTKPVAAGALTDTALIDSITLKNGQVVEVIASAIQSEPAKAVGEAWGVTIAENSVTAYAG